MKLLNIISGPIKDGNINGNLVTVILVLINYRSKYLTNFEANAKQNEVKINNRFSEELPADADETMLRDRLKTRVYVTPQIPSNPK
jgi:hypothetical protein